VVEKAKVLQKIERLKSGKNYRKNLNTMLTEMQKDQKIKVIENLDDPDESINSSFFSDEAHFDKREM
jgi:hypothetical protein